MQHKNGHAAWIWGCGTDIDTQPVTGTCSMVIDGMDMGMHRGHKPEQATFNCLGRMAMSKLYVQVQTAYPTQTACLSPYCVSMFILQVHVHAARPCHATCPCQCYMSISVLRVHVHNV